MLKRTQNQLINLNNLNKLNKTIQFCTNRTYAKMLTDLMMLSEADKKSSINKNQTYFESKVCLLNF